MALLNDEEIAERLAALPGWTRQDDAITRSFEFADFVGSVDFVTRLTPQAEELGHHPDLSISWNTVEVTMTTHSAGGLTNNDFLLAQRLDGLA